MHTAPKNPGAGAAFAAVSLCNIGAQANQARNRRNIGLAATHGSTQHSPVVVLKRLLLYLEMSSLMIVWVEVRDIGAGF
jgi:hypothetical protein